MADGAANPLAKRAEDVIIRGSKSFAAAARLFPPDMRRDVMLLYAWCRHCDDQIDGQELGRGTIRTASGQILEELRSESLNALAGKPSPELAFQALADLSRRHSISRTLVEAHIAGFELDVTGWQPKTLDDTLQYCYHTAGTVGIMLARIMNVRDLATLYRASDLGIAFQLTNIARDVAEDAQGGRSYLPEAWRLAAGLAVTDLANPGPQEARQAFELVARLINVAEPYYDSAAIGIHALPRRSAWAIATARAIYRDIGRTVLQQGPGALSERAFTGTAGKIWRMIASVPSVLSPRKTWPETSRSGLWTPCLEALSARS